MKGTHTQLNDTLRELQQLQDQGESERAPEPEGPEDDPLPSASAARSTLKVFEPSNFSGSEDLGYFMIS